MVINDDHPKTSTFDLQGVSFYIYGGVDQHPGPQQLTFKLKKVGPNQFYDDHIGQSTAFVTYPMSSRWGNNGLKSLGMENADRPNMFLHVSTIFDKGTTIYIYIYTVYSVYCIYI